MPVPSTLPWIHSPGVGEPSIGELFLALCQGDRASAASLYEQLTPMLLAVARRNGVPQDALGDIAGNTWLALLDNCDKIRDPEAVAGWLRRTATNFSMQWHRKRRRERPEERIPEEPKDDPDMTTHEKREALEQQLEAMHFALTRLDTRCRRMVDLRLQTPQLTNKEIAAEMDMPLGGVGPTLRRCLDKLRTHMGDVR